MTGAHGNNVVLQTFLFADWNDAEIFSVPIQDIHALSHEVAEWLNDPFINNIVPPYQNAEQTGCDTLMETGDQLVGNTVPVTINGFTYHPADPGPVAVVHARNALERVGRTLSVPG